MSDPFQTASPAELQWDVFVAPSKPVATDDVPPGVPRRMWSPISATLISGKRDAVLVDPLMTVEETRALSDWIGATGKNLMTIYVTHGHGDHSFGISILRERFPDARAVATPRVLQHMRKQTAPDFLQSFWKSRFPRQLPDEIVFPDALEGDEFDLEGHDLVVVGSRAYRHGRHDLPLRSVDRAGGCRRRRLQRRAFVPRRVRSTGPARVDRSSRQDRVTAAARGGRRTQACRQR
jgi:hypothetical protein